MRSRILVILALTLAWTVQAKEHEYNKGTLMLMQSTSCGTAEKGNKTVAGELLGTDAEHKTTAQVLCQEYTLQADRVIYKIRPRDDKHPVLLPIGETAEFRIEKDKLILRIPEMNDKEREYVVVSMTPRTDVADSRASAKPADH
jgi:hypothetical protein